MTFPELFLVVLFLLYGCDRLIEHIRSRLAINRVIQESMRFNTRL